LHISIFGHQNLGSGSGFTLNAGSEFNESGPQHRIKIKKIKRTDGTREIAMNKEKREVVSKGAGN
jgi:hypothetical protein